MKQKLNLELYVSMGGKIENLNLEKVSITYKPISEKIVSITDAGIDPKSNMNVYDVKFQNGNIDRYAGMWIDTQIELKLENKYTNTDIDSSFILIRYTPDCSERCDISENVAVASSEETLKSYCLEKFGKPIGTPEKFSWEPYYKIYPSEIKSL